MIEDELFEAAAEEGGGAAAGAGAMRGRALLPEGPGAGAEKAAADACIAIIGKVTTQYVSLTRLQAKSILRYCRIPQCCATLFNDVAREQHGQLKARQFHGRLRWQSKRMLVNNIR